MVSRKKKLTLTFIIGFITIIFVLPVLYALGVPRGEVVLTALFGEGSMWAVIFSLLCIGLVIFGISKATK